MNEILRARPTGRILDVDGRGVERAQFALSALLEGHRRVASDADAARLAIETWNLLLSTQNGRTLLADVPVGEMTSLRDWMVAAIAADAGLPLRDVLQEIDSQVGSHDDPWHG